VTNFGKVCCRLSDILFVRILDVPPYSAKLHLPSTALDGRDLDFPCTVEFCNGAELRILCGVPLAARSAVSVEHEDALLLGEVVRSFERADAWCYSIRVKQVLNGLISIMALRSHLLKETAKVPEWR
jgi:hypothetical protein